ncbi:MAG: hydroxymethylbilane synthase [Acidimicrobiales bacterium]
MTPKVAVTLSTTKLRIATRNSPLALWQADHVAKLLRAIEPGLDVTMVSMETFGDRRLDLSIPELGGKGVFSKEVQQLVITGEADLAVHSAKDLQAVTPEELVIAAYPERGDPRDALIGCSMADLAEGAAVATGSNRRSALLLDERPDLKLHPLRGNIATRLTKLRDFDAVVLAAVALDRLAVEPPVVDRLDPAGFVPQVGQGALAVEIRRDDQPLLDLVSGINHAETALTVSAERSFLAELGGDCNLPAGAYARLVNGSALVHGRGGPDGVAATTDAVIEIRGVLASADCTGLQRAVEAGPPSVDPGRVLARHLRKQLEAAESADGR